eukprot:1905287-Amphidinium_carterae.1
MTVARNSPTGRSGRDWCCCPAAAMRVATGTCTSETEAMPSNSNRALHHAKGFSEAASPDTCEWRPSHLLAKPLMPP